MEGGIFRKAQQPIPDPDLIASSKISFESPPASHIANPARPAPTMYLPFAAVR